MAALVAFLLIVACCLAAPLYAHWANTDPFKSTLDLVIKLNGEDRPVMEQSTEGLGLGYTPMGPTWQLGNYFLGADNQGRDVMARLLYGGLNSLIIAGAATILTLFFGTLLGLLAGFFGGLTDTILSRILDVLWAFPVYLLAISLSIVLIAEASRSVRSPSSRVRSGCPSSSSASSIFPMSRVPFAARCWRCAKASSCSRPLALAFRSIAFSCATSCPMSPPRSSSSCRS